MVTRVVRALVPTLGTVGIIARLLCSEVMCLFLSVGYELGCTWSLPSKSENWFLHGLEKIVFIMKAFGRHRSICQDHAARFPNGFFSALTKLSASICSLLHWCQKACYILLISLLALSPVRIFTELSGDDGRGINNSIVSILKHTEKYNDDALWCTDLNDALFLKLRISVFGGRYSKCYFLIHGCL